MIQIKRITMDHPLYSQECALRESVLLRPLGLSLADFGRELPGLEERLEHFVAVFAHPNGPRVIGCAALLPNNPVQGVGRLMQMAVDLQRQGEGIGKRLVVAVERRAFGELGLRELYCHAQLPATGFYANLGWEFDGDVFKEAGLEHRKMVFRPPPPADDLVL